MISEGLVMAVVVSLVVGAITKPQQTLYAVGRWAERARKYGR